jgi:hypothetical protein
MKLIALISAGFVATAALAPVSAANAAPHHARWKTVCKTQWVHHRKVRRCHKVRVTRRHR